MTSDVEKLADIVQAWDEPGFSRDTAIELASRIVTAGFGTATTQRTVKRVQEHLLGKMDEGTYVHPDAIFTAGEIRESIWELFDAADLIRDHAVPAPSTIAEEPVAWAIRGRKTGRIREVTTDAEYADECREHYDVIPLVEA